MSRELLNHMAVNLPGASLSDPWGGGHDAWKIGGKIFACMSAQWPGVSLKTDSIETAALLIELGVGRKAPYFHRSWISLPLDAEPDELEARLRESYRLVRATLPKKVQAEFPPLT